MYNILVCDDEKDIVSALEIYLSAEGYQVFTAHSGQEMLDTVAREDIHLVLLDINLGDGSGFEVCKMLREDTQLPILFISARQSDDDVLIALSIGGDDYVKKPYSLSVLLAKVKVNLKRVDQIRQAQNMTVAE